MTVTGANIYCTSTRRGSGNCSNSNSASIERQLREQILLGVEKILLREPSRASLYSLLKLCTPNLGAETLDNAVAREKAFRSVKARLHPDKFDASRTAKMTQVFQNVQTYYMECCHALADEVVGRYKKRDSNGSTSTSATTTSSSSSSTRTTSHKPTYSRTDSPKSVLEVPLEMDAMIKFPQLRQIPRPSPFQAVSTSELYYHLGYACLNLRGSVLHRAAIDCTYQVPVNLVETSRSPASIEAVWAEAGFVNPKHLTTVEDIKHDILRHGPVVSTSFVLDPYYYKSNTRVAGNFSERHVGRPHPLLITGWKMSAHGQVWCVQALRGATFTIGMGQFDVDKLCLAPPAAALEVKSWQAPGPYWDVPGLANKCLAWRDHFQQQHGGGGPLSAAMLELMPLDSSDIDHLGDLWNVGLHAVIMERRTFVLRDAVKQAQSRRVMLRDMARVQHEGRKVWKVTVSVVRK